MLRELAEPSGLALGFRVVPKAEGWPFLSIIRSNQRTFLVQGTEAGSVTQFCGWLRINGFRPDWIGSSASTLVADAAPITFHPSLRFDPYSRAMAKVALNFVCYRLGAELSLHPAFDEVRSFARYGTGNCFDLVCPTLLNHSLEDANAAFFSHEDHGLVLFKAGPNQGGKVGVFIVIQGKTVGRVSLNGSSGVLPESAWLLTRFSSTKHTVEDYVLPDDMPRAVVNPGALGMRDVWPREWA